MTGHKPVRRNTIAHASLSGVGCLPRPLLLITPTLSEYTAVRTAVTDWLADGKLQLAMCGMGPACAAALCQQLERSGWLGNMALIGWAGGLCPNLAAGDSVLADAAMNIHGQRVPLAPPNLPGTKVGALLTTPAPLLTQQAKKAVQKSNALAVEMEAYPLAVWAAAHNLPFVHARVILDAANEALPDLGDALDAFGRVRPGRLAQRLLAQPPMTLDLLRLAHRAKKLEPNLQALARAVAALWQQ